MKRWLVASLILLVPALVQAKGSSWTPLTKNDSMVKTMIAKELNARKLGVSGKAHYTMTSVTGEKKFLGGSPMFGSTTAIKFMAQPKVKVSYSDGKSAWVKIGGVRGECKYGSMMCRPPAISSLKITSLLR